MRALTYSALNVVCLVCNARQDGGNHGKEGSEVEGHPAGRPEASTAVMDARTSRTRSCLQFLARMVAVVLGRTAAVSASGSVPRF